MKNREGALVIYVVELLERAAYYGARIALVLYATAESGLAITREEISFYVEYFVFAGLFIDLVLSFFADRVLGHKRAVTIGGGITVIGCSLLLGSNSIIIFAGLVLILIGSGFVKPNLIVLLGGMYRTTDHRRDAAFMLRNFLVNIGAALGTFLLGVLAEKYNYSYALGVAALLTLAYWLLFLFGRKWIAPIAHDLPHNSLSNEPTFTGKRHTHTDNYSKILDEEVIAATAPVIPEPSSFSTKPSKRRYVFLLLVLLLSCLHSAGNDITVFVYQAAMEDIRTIIVFGQEVYSSVFFTIDGTVTMIAGFFFSLIWFTRKTGDSLGRIISGFIISTLALVLLLVLMNWLTEKDIPNIISAIAIFSVGELIVQAVVLSYVTRLSPARYASTILSGYLLLSYFGWLGLDWVMRFLDVQTQMIIGIVTFSVVTMLLFFTKKTVAHLVSV